MSAVFGSNAEFISQYIGRHQTFLGKLRLRQGAS
jgi:hypothetical protein